MLNKKEVALLKFEQKYVPIPECGCWIWIGEVNERGYGFFYFNSYDRQRAHRAAWRLFCGEIPKGLYVCHKCDTPSCVNPYHLFLGTHKDNMRDAIEKGRKPPCSCPVKKGEENNSKLTNEDVLNIRKDTRNKKLIAAEYGVHLMTIYKILRRAQWKHI